MREQVWLHKCKGYKLDDLCQLVDQAFTALHVYDSLKPGMTAVLKPNLLMASKPEEAIATHPLFTAAVGICVQKAGAGVLIAESPGGPYTPVMMRQIFRACGYQDIAKEYNFTLYTECKARELSIPNGLRCRQASIVEPFIDADYLIDLAKLKTHGMVGYSGAVKNMFGAVPGLKKPELHCRFPDKEDFSHMLLDLCDYLKPDLSLIDGIWAMEGDGPSGGDRRELGVLLASRSPFAADLCGAALIGSGPEKIRMLDLAAKRGLGPVSLDEVEIIGDPIEGLIAADFVPAKAGSTDFIDKLPPFLRPAAKKLATPKPKINKKLCVGCGKCAESCPQKAIRLAEGKAVIDLKNCIRCFCCQEMCPKHIVEVKRLQLFNL